MRHKTFNKYEEIRPEMKQGDIVAFYRGNSLGDRIYSFLLYASGMGAYTHIAIVHREEFRHAERVWVIESEPGIGGHVQALSRYDGRGFDVFDCPVDADTAVDVSMTMLDRIRRYNWNQIFELVHYGFIRRFEYWIKGKFTKNLPPLTAAKDSLICSSFVTQALTKSDWKIEKPGMWPDAVVKQLKDKDGPRLRYRSKIPKSETE
jgi:hypothetical protein